EGSQDQVRFGDALDYVGVGGIDESDNGTDGLMLGIHPSEQRDADQQIDQRACYSDPEFFVRFWTPLQPRNAADGKHNDLNGPDAVTRGHCGVRELVRQYGGEQRNQVERIIHARLIAAETGEDKIYEQQNEGEMQADGNPHEPESPHRSCRSSAAVGALHCWQKISLFLIL